MNKIKIELNFLELLLKAPERYHPVRELVKAFRETHGRVSSVEAHITLMRMRKWGWVEAEDSQDADGLVRSYRVTGLGEVEWRKENQ